MDLHVGRRLSVAEISELLQEARERTFLLVGSLSEEDLRRQHDPLMSPIVWDLGHIAHFEEVWLLENVDGGETASEGLRGIYDPFRNPRAVRDELPLPSLSECRGYMGAIRRAALQRAAEVDLDADEPLLKDGFVYRLVLQHEYQHNETILQTLQLKLGAPYEAPRMLAAPDGGAAPPPGATVRFEGGTVPMGTDDHSAAYDNERPLHELEVPPFEIDVHPVTNGAFARFVDDGGYARRDAWSAEGWAWSREAALREPMYWGEDGRGRTERFMDRTVPLAEDHPVCHVSYWEADAYARWAGMRLPTETEWEVAASWDPVARAKRRYPWGDEAPDGLVANLDALLFGTTPVGAYPGGASPLGCWDMLGNVWEWTSSDFGPYPGYRTFPYPEYSEVFFGSDYKVLRGGSWATRFGAIRNTFRNWDYPIRRQIFSGVRCARSE